jgi:hypothetical protein
MMVQSEVLKACPFPHEVKRGVFLEIDTVDFCFVRGACSDCGCAGPYVTLDSCERVTDAERDEAARLWNTRTPAVATDEGVVDPDVIRRLKSVATTLETCGKHGIPIDFALLASDIRAAISAMAHPGD